MLTPRILRHLRLLPHRTPCHCRNFAQPSLHPTPAAFKIALAKKHPYERTSEQDYLVRMKNDPDVFGSPSRHQTAAEIDEGDVREDKFLEERPLPGRKPTTKQYADQIKELIAKRKIQEAVDVLEIRMLKEDRVKPENYIYNLLIGACGRVGYTKKAFSLFNTMKKRRLEVHASVYTALFNACANSPWPTTDGLTRAQHLKELMLEKHCEPNVSNYHAMIKAFGRGGDLPAAFAVVDEMRAHALQLREETLNFLLQACVSERDVGFRHMLLVWRKFAEYGIKPSVFSYNLMLKVVRECGVGDVEVMTEVINRLLGEERVRVAERDGERVAEVVASTTTLRLAEGEGEKENALVDTTLADQQSSSIVADVCPNLLAPAPHLGNVLSLAEVKTAQDRFLLVGGFRGFMKNMEDDGVQPNIKTLTQLLETIPSTFVAEKELLLAAKKYKIKLDVDFFNILIRKRSMRFDYESAKEVLEEIKLRRKRPNIVTYGVLALGCKTREDAQGLIDEMKGNYFRLNVEIVGAMLKQACFHKNFHYVHYIMDLCVEERIAVGPKFLEILHDFRKCCRRMTNDENDEMGQSRAFQKRCRAFKLKHAEWLQQVEVDKTDEIHPWQQYRQEVKTDVKRYKDKEASTRFQPVHLSRFRVRTSTKRRW